MSRPDKIQTMGLKKYLNSTAAKHNNLDYVIFCTLVETHVSISSMARAFGVTRHTMGNWVNVYNLESRVPKL